ncbi:MAG: nonstructural protein [Microviridae sp.]|nr:MAG: nonstructural protein [Microviridae sp.]
MKTFVYVVLDKLAGAYGTPFVMQNDAIASRDFAFACKQPESSLSRHPADYSLWCIASYDDNSGIIEPLEKMRYIADAINFTTLEA